MDHPFQFRFLIWHLFFGGRDLAKSLRKLNSSLELQDLLECPVKTYHQSTLHRFIHRVGEATLRHVHVLLVRRCIQQGLINANHLLLDGFPIFSYLNTQKCLRNPKIDIEVCKTFFTQLNLTTAVDLLPKQRNHALPMGDKLSGYCFEILWNMPSRETCGKRIKEGKGLETALTFQKRCPAFSTYKRFRRWLVIQANFGVVQKRILTALGAIPAVHDRLGLIDRAETLEELKGLMANPLPAWDCGTRLNVCASKNLKYWGREDHVLCDGDTKLAMLIGVQSITKLGLQEFKTFLGTFKEYYEDLVTPKEFLGDAEFSEGDYAKVVRALLKAPPISLPPRPRNEEKSSESNGSSKD